MGVKNEGFPISTIEKYELTLRRKEMRMKKTQRQRDFGPLGAWSSVPDCFDITSHEHFYAGWWNESSTEVAPELGLWYSRTSGNLVAAEVITDANANDWTIIPEGANPKGLRLRFLLLTGMSLQSVENFNKLDLRGATELGR